MKRNELIILTKEALGLDTKVAAEGFIKEVDALFKALANKLEAGDKVRIGEMISVERKLVLAKEGTVNGVPYKTEEHCKLVIKPSEVLKREAK